MLVDPVGHERAGDPRVPPGLRPHLLDPLPGGVPVVVHVVVVEDHRARHRREEPPGRRVLPRLAVEVGVLLEVGDLVLRRRVAAPVDDEPAGAGRDLVGIDLVAQPHQDVRPLVRVLPAHAAGESEQRVDLAPARILVLAQRVRLVVRERDAAGAEGEPDASVPRQGADGALREHVARRRPGVVAVEPHLVRRGRPRLQALDHDQGVVVAVHLEGARRVIEDLDLAGAVGLHPHGRLVVRDVAQEGSQDELGHLQVPYPAWPGSTM